MRRHNTAVQRAGLGSRPAAPLAFSPALSPSLSLPPSIYPSGWVKPGLPGPA